MNRLKVTKENLILLCKEVDLSTPGRRACKLEFYDEFCYGERKWWLKWYEDGYCCYICLTDCKDYVSLGSKVAWHDGDTGQRVHYETREVYPDQLQRVGIIEEIAGEAV